MQFNLGFIKFRFGSGLLLQGSGHLVVGSNNTVVGAKNWVIGLRCAVEGDKCVVVGYDSNVEGNENRLIGYSSHCVGARNRLYGVRVTSEGEDNVSKLSLTPRTFLFFSLALLFSAFFPFYSIIGLIGLSLYYSKTETETEGGSKSRLHNVLAILCGVVVRFLLRITLFSFVLPVLSLVAVGWFVSKEWETPSDEQEDLEDIPDLVTEPVVTIGDDSETLDDDDEDDQFPMIPFVFPEEDKVEDEHFLLCPISHELMMEFVSVFPSTNFFVSPVTVVDSGHTYDRKSILEWWMQHDTDPLTNLPVRKALIENKLIRQIVYARLARQ